MAKKENEELEAPLLNGFSAPTKQETKVEAVKPLVAEIAQTSPSFINKLMKSIGKFFGSETPTEVVKENVEIPQPKKEPTRNQRNPRQAKDNRNNRNESNDRNDTTNDNNNERRTNRKNADRKPAKQAKKYDNEAKTTSDNNDINNNQEVIVARRKRRNMRKKVRVQQPENVVETKMTEIDASKNQDINNQSSVNVGTEQPKVKTKAKKTHPVEENVETAKTVSTDVQTVNNDLLEDTATTEKEAYTPVEIPQRRSRYLRNNGQRNKQDKEQSEAIVSRYPESKDDVTSEENVESVEKPVKATVPVAKSVNELTEMETPQQEAEKLQQVIQESPVTTAEKILPVESKVSPQQKAPVQQAEQDTLPEVTTPEVNAIEEVNAIAAQAPSETAIESVKAEPEVVEKQTEETVVTPTPEVQTSPIVKQMTTKGGTVSMAKGKSTSAMVKTVSAPLDLTKELTIVAATERQAIVKSAQQAGSSFASNRASSDMFKTSL
jgi:ribonuclease E